MYEVQQIGKLISFIVESGILASKEYATKTDNL